MAASESTEKKMLNVGCGRCYHADWVNLDMSHSDPAVVQHDILAGIPFQEDSFDVVYHSHVLEHLSPDEGQTMIRECYRVLKPGGVLRIVVPDLEQIARLYLQQHELACQGDETAQANYDWMKLELIDQMVRRNSGGRMGQFITSPMISNPEFVLSRLGSEFDICIKASAQQSAHSIEKPRQNRWQKRFQKRLEKLRAKSHSLRMNFVSKMVGLVLGSKMRRAFEEGVFRSQGEVHRWMYDRYSLNQLCRQVGFINGSAKSAFESQIDRFVTFQLDSINGEVRKPDSLFFECQKPDVNALPTFIRFPEPKKAPTPNIRTSAA